MALTFQCWFSQHPSWKAPIWTERLGSSRQGNKLLQACKHWQAFPDDNVKLNPTNAGSVYRQAVSGWVGFANVCDPCQDVKIIAVLLQCWSKVTCCAKFYTLIQFPAIICVSNRSVNLQEMCWMDFEPAGPSNVQQTLSFRRKVKS